MGRLGKLKRNEKVHHHSPFVEEDFNKKIIPWKMTFSQMSDNIASIYGSLDIKKRSRSLSKLPIL